MRFLHRLWVLGHYPPKKPFFVSPRDFTLSQRGKAPFLLGLRIMRNEGPITINAAYTQPRPIDAHYAHERAIALLKGFEHCE